MPVEGTPTSVPEPASPLVTSTEIPSPDWGDPPEATAPELSGPPTPVDQPPCLDAASAVAPFPPAETSRPPDDPEAPPDDPTPPVVVPELVSEPPPGATVPPPPDAPLPPLPPPLPPAPLPAPRELALPLPVVVLAPEPSPDEPPPASPPSLTRRLEPPRLRPKRRASPSERPVGELEACAEPGPADMLPVETPPPVLPGTSDASPARADCGSGTPTPDAASAGMGTASATPSSASSRFESPCTVIALPPELRTAARGGPRRWPRVRVGRG
jgi:hypothetical protein